MAPTDDNQDGGNQGRGGNPHPMPEKVIFNSHNLNVEKLDGISNYITWKFSMKMALILDSLWECIEHDQQAPVDRLKDQKAFARIALCVKPNLFQHLHGCKTSKEAWDKLGRIFADKGIYRRVILLRQLYRIDYQKYNDMTMYIDTVMTLVRQLEDIGKTLQDDEIAIKYYFKITAVGFLFLNTSTCFPQISDRGDDDTSIIHQPSTSSGSSGRLIHPDANELRSQSQEVPGDDANQRSS
ncbi:gag-polypeptide of LTR copia-type domain-containing protein [Phthorimaea operculella]|nr:gag-polypeptide of LTR copia-type domain-containing protein [Phthorimaea operculella]